MKKGLPMVQVSALYQAARTLVSEIGVTQVITREALRNVIPEMDLDDECVRLAEHKLDTYMAAEGYRVGGKTLRVWAPWWRESSQMHRFSMVGIVGPTALRALQLGDDAYPDDLPHGVQLTMSRHVYLRRKP